MRRTKFVIVTERLATRIQNGDYHIQGIPSERDLAVEFGVSHMTARKSVQKLLNDGLLYRLPNGRLGIKDSVHDSGMINLQIALLAPAWISGETDIWHINLSRLTERFNFSLRAVYYFHADDPIIKNTINSFNCTFFLPDDPFPANIITELRALDNPFIILGNDWSEWGIPSIRLFQPVFVQKMLEHLEDIGHKRIDCLNTQPGKTIIPRRISQWKTWIDVHGIKGKLIDEPVPHFKNALIGAYDVVTRLIREDKFDSPALFCVTGPAALGAMRAMADHGIKPGLDVAVCTADSGLSYEYNVPSVTSMKIQEPDPFLISCLKWLREKDRQWVGPLLLQPEIADVVIGETTIPGIKRKRGSEATQNFEF